MRSFVASRSRVYYVDRPLTVLVVGQIDIRLYLKSQASFESDLVYPMVGPNDFAIRPWFSVQNELTRRMR